MLPRFLTAHGAPTIRPARPDQTIRPGLRGVEIRLRFDSLPVFHSPPSLSIVAVHHRLHSSTSFPAFRNTLLPPTGTHDETCRAEARRLRIRPFAVSHVGAGRQASGIGPNSGLSLRQSSSICNSTDPARGDAPRSTSPTDEFTHLSASTLGDPTLLPPDYRWRRRCRLPHPHLTDWLDAVAACFAASGFLPETPWRRRDRPGTTRESASPP